MEMITKFLSQICFQFTKFAVLRISLITFIAISGAHANPEFNTDANDASDQTPATYPAGGPCSPIAQLFADETVTVRGRTVAAAPLITELYTRGDSNLLWQRGNAIRELIAMVDASYQEGLKPEDYHQRTLREMYIEYRAGELTACERASFDLLLTDALIHLGYHFAYGKVNPRQLDTNWNLRRGAVSQDPAEAILEIIKRGAIGDTLGGLLPSTPFYIQMRETLAAYRQIEAEGGWPVIPPGRMIKPGMRSERLLPLRRRLRITGDVAESGVSDPAVYDHNLQSAVERYQRRQGLEPDAIIGKRTLAALNTPVASRINQIRVNMERARWLFREAPSEYLIVDIAGFQAMYFLNDRLLWASSAQVGRPYRKTPVFQDTLEYIVLNPSWTVPPTIFRKDILPRLKQTPGYLAEHRMRVIDDHGMIVDPSSIDWQEVTGRNFPHQIRQAPGPKNALGRMKFMFPNKHLVYLHDTPHKAGFKSAKRAFSSGCIRIERPLELAQLLLRDQKRWSLENIRSAVAAGDTRNVRLKRTVPVFLLYWTVDKDNEGLYFKPDLYNRDNVVLKALNGGSYFDTPYNAVQRRPTPTNGTVTRAVTAVSGASDG